ncbi:hypothetical protein BDA96_03G213500 [Sorghum bicolor]|uniref:Uncharacterized protein n=1 Tax=Sorghum bicolor TaxID=4558 RepID=A0A921RDR7_SORBI|nr:hypothetical protein BDA96_03G213500 [Sorghum bicolor]
MRLPGVIAGSPWLRSFLRHRFPTASGTPFPCDSSLVAGGGTVETADHLAASPSRGAVPMAANLPRRGSSTMAADLLWCASVAPPHCQWGENTRCRRFARQCGSLLLRCGCWTRGGLGP